MDAEQTDLVSNKVLISGSQKSPEVMIELKLNTEQGNQYRFASEVCSRGNGLPPGALHDAPPTRL
jgi:hypothetical protein